MRVREPWAGFRIRLIVPEHIRASILKGCKYVGCGPRIALVRFSEWRVAMQGPNTSWKLPASGCVFALVSVNPSIACSFIRCDEALDQRRTVGRCWAVEQSHQRALGVDVAEIFETLPMGPLLPMLVTSSTPATPQAKGITRRRRQ